MEAMNNTATSRDARWDERCAQLLDHFTIHGTLPKHAGADASLYLWLRKQRAAVARGTCPPERRLALERIPGALNTGPSRMKQLETFQADTGRLPSTGATDEFERSLARYLIHHLRPLIRKGTISAQVLAQVRAIPGAEVIRTVPNQDAVLEELREYVQNHGHMPPEGGSGTAQENRLSNWFRNNVRGSATQKTPRRRERHEALLALAACTHRKSDALLLSRLSQTEDFLASHGHRPGLRNESTQDERSLAVWLSHVDPSALDRISARRLDRILAHPSHSDLSWNAMLKALHTHAKVRDGALPTMGDNARLYRWVGTQRLAARQGKLPDWKAEKLHALPGVLPVHLAVAA